MEGADDDCQCKICTGREFESSRSLEPQAKVVGLSHRHKKAPSNWGARLLVGEDLGSAYC